MTGQSHWLYAIARPCSELADLEVAGIGDRPVRTTVGGEIAAVTTILELDGPESFGVQAALNDLSTLEPLARAHHRVAETVARITTALPARLATVLGDDGSLDALLVQRRDQLRQALDQVEGSAEWGIRIYPGRSVSTVDSPAEDDPARGPGARYLRLRRAELAARQDDAVRNATAAQTVYQTLAHHSRYARRSPAGQFPHNPAPVLTGAFLVADASKDDFLAAAVSLRDEHPQVRVELTGPWPAYSFAADLTGEDDAAR